MNRRIPPDELPWFRRRDDRGGYSGQLHYAAPVGVADRGTEYIPTSSFFPYMIRTWASYRPKVLVVASYISPLTGRALSALTDFDVFDTDNGKFGDVALRDIAPHYDLILAEYHVADEDEWWVGERLTHARCMLVQWSPANSIDITFSTRRITSTHVCVEYTGFCCGGRVVGSVRDCFEKLLDIDFKMFHHL